MAAAERCQWQTLIPIQLYSSNMSGLVRWLATANPRLKGEWPAQKTDGLTDPNDKREERCVLLPLELSMADGQSTKVRPD